MGEDLAKSDNPSKKWIYVLLVISVLVMLIGGVIFLSLRTLNSFMAHDAVQVIAYEVSDLYTDNPNTSQEDIEELIKWLHDASVINLKVNNEGKAVDPFGIPFRVEYEKKPDRSITTVTSAGPDQAFGTEDDIIFVCPRLLE